MSKTRPKRKGDEEKNEPTQGRVAVAYEGPASDVFAGGAVGGGLGAVFGFLIGGPVGAALGGALGAAIGGYLGAVSEEEKRKQKG